MSEPLSIKRVVDRLLDGTIRIPGFQRPFVWPPEKAALLMDSLYKQYPVGSLLLWRTGQRLKRENRLGVFNLPEPAKDYPIDYVLDGQQRITSIFTTFQRELNPESDDPEKWLPIWYDFDAQEDAQDSRFVALEPFLASKERHFPLSTFFDPVEFAHATRDLLENKHREIVAVQNQFLTTLIPVTTFETEDRGSVAIVFERVNRVGIPLDTFQLLTAWTWSDEFDLQERFTALSEEFDEFGFSEVGEDNDLMMRCCSAVLTRDSSPTSLVTMHGGNVRESFPLVEESIRRAIDFVRANFQIRHIKFMPYSSLLIPLTAFFSTKSNKSVTDTERIRLTTWFWRACFSHRYSGNPQRNIRRDIEESVNLGMGRDSGLAEIYCNVSPAFFIDHTFTFRNVATKSLILLLASMNPKSFLSGQPISLDDVLSEPNRREYHHCFPRAAALREGYSQSQANVLANFAFLSRADNRTISDKKPSEYRTMMPGDVTYIQESAVLPDSLFDDNFDQFITERSNKLYSLLVDLANLTDSAVRLGHAYNPRKIHATDQSSSLLIYPRSTDDSQD